MDKKVFLKCIHDEFRWILDLGYSFRPVDTSIYFEKNNDDVDYCINFFWAEFNEIKIQGLFAFKRFKLIENLIENVTGNLDFTIRLPLQYNDLNDVNLSILTPQGEIYLSDEHDIKEFSVYVQELFNRVALPFYQNFSSLQEVGKWMNENNIKDHSKLLSVSNNSMMLRKLIILKEINSGEFSELYEKYKTYLIEKNETKEKVYQDMYMCFLNFKRYFESHPT